MTTAEKAAYTATLLDYLDVPVSNEVIIAYLEAAAEGILNKMYPFGCTATDVPEKYSRRQCEIAAYLINKRGAEGQLSHNENGVSRSYEAAHIPTSMLRSITSFCGVIG